MQYYTIFLSIYICVSLMLKINSKLEIIGLTQHDCFIVSKKDWNGYILAMVALMFIFIF